MAGLAAVRDALGARLETVSGLRVYPDLAGSVAVPAAVIVPRRAEIHGAMQRGLVTYNLEVFLLATLSGSRGGRQDTLDALLDPAQPATVSAVAAILADRTLGLSETDAIVESWSDYGARFEAAAVDHLGAILAVTVRTEGV